MFYFVSTADFPFGAEIGHDYRDGYLQDYEILGYIREKAYARLRARRITVAPTYLAE